jgi:hypothetical protein
MEVEILRQDTKTYIARATTVMTDGLKCEVSRILAPQNTQNHPISQITSIIIIPTTATSWAKKIAGIRERNWG